MDKGITRERAESLALQEVAAAGLGLVQRRGVEYVLVPLDQFVDRAFARLTAAHAADVQLAATVARPPRAVRRGHWRTR